MTKERLLELNPQELADMVYKSMTEKDNLIKYLEDEIKQCKEDKKYMEKVIKESSAYESGLIDAYYDILERIKNNNYD